MYQHMIKLFYCTEILLSSYDYLVGRYQSRLKFSLLILHGNYTICNWLKTTNEQYLFYKNSIVYLYDHRNRYSFSDTCRRTTIVINAVEIGN